MKVLFIGDAGPSGFGTVTYEIGTRLLKLGEDVRFISQNDLGGVAASEIVDRALSIPSLVQVQNSLTGEGGNVGANDILGEVLTGKCDGQLMTGEPWGDWQPEAVILLGDFATARHVVAITPAFGQVPTYHYIPIEGRSLPPTLNGDLWTTTHPVAMSEFGADEIAKVSGTRPPVVYHGVDTTVFHPIKPSRPVTVTAKEGKIQLTSRADCKEMWSLFFATKFPVVKADNQLGRRHTDKWMLRTDRHMPRKGYNAMLRGLLPVLGMNGDAILIIHCQSTDQGGSMPDSISKLPGATLVDGSLDETQKPQAWSILDRPYPQIMLTNASGIAREALVTLYNAADLYVSTSAEGFGLTIAEALACGTPAVGLDYSAVPEVIGPAGRLVPFAYEFDNQYDHLWAAVDEQRLAATVHALLNNPTEREALGRKGPRHIYHTFSWDTAAQQFLDLVHAGSLEAAA